MAKKRVDKVDARAKSFGSGTLKHFEIQPPMILFLKSVSEFFTELMIWFSHGRQGSPCNPTESFSPFPAGLPPSKKFGYLNRRCHQLGVDDPFGDQKKAELVIVSRDSDYGITFNGSSLINDHLAQEFTERVSR